MSAVVLLLSLLDVQAKSWCEGIGAKTNADTFVVFRECFLFGPPADTSAAQELFQRASFALEEGYWTRRDQTGQLHIRAAIEGRGKTVFVTFKPQNVEAVAPAILDYLLRVATEVDPASPAPAFKIRRSTEAPATYDNCTGTDEFTVSSSGRLLSQGYRLLCTK